VREGLTAKWKIRRNPPGVDYTIAIKVLSVGDHVKMEVLQQEGERTKADTVSVPTDAVPVAVAALFMGTELPTGDVCWTPGPARDAEWSAPVGKHYKVTAVTRGARPPRLIVRRTYTTTAGPPFWQLEPAPE
jgi:hypothetical protein